MSKCEPVLAFCSFPLCRNKAASECVCAYLGRSLAMCLLKPSSLRHNASSPIKLVFAMRLRLSNVSSQCVCVTQCVLAMRLRHPMRIQNASSECACACSCVLPFFDERVFTMQMRLQVFLPHSARTSQCMYYYIFTYFTSNILYLCLCIHTYM